MIDLPPLAQTPEANALAKRLVQRAFEMLMPHLPEGSFEAVILIGAMTRGEGSVLERLDGSLALLSDIDFLIVTKSPAWHRKLRGDLPKRALEANAALRPEGLTSHVDYLTALPDEIQSWPSSISSNEVLASGVVVAGEGPVSRFFPAHVKPETIDPHDSLAMIHTRMMGQLLFLKDLDSEEQSRFDFALYHCAKVITDLAAIALSYHGGFVCSCRGRLDAMLEFVESEMGKRLNGEIPDLIDRIALWTDYKLNPDEKMLAGRCGQSPDREGLRAIGHEAWEWHRSAMRVLWREEMEGIFHIPQSVPIDDALVVLAKAPSSKRLLKSWAKTWLHPASEWKRLSAWRTLTSLARGQEPLGQCFASAAAMYFADHFPPDEQTLHLAKRFSPLPTGRCDCYQPLLDQLLWLWLLLVKGGAE